MIMCNIIILFQGLNRLIIPIYILCCYTISIENAFSGYRIWTLFNTTFRRGLDLLKAEEGAIVYRGGNKGLDQKTVARDYTIGRPIQWAAFSSTTVSPSGVRLFVRKNEGK